MTRSGYPLVVTFSVFFGRSEERQKFVAEVKLNWNLTEQSPQNQIGAPDQLHSELNLRPQIATERTLRGCSVAALD